MNLRKTAALLLSLIMCVSLIVPIGSLAEGTVTAADNAKRSEDLLAFAGRLHNMTEKYSAEYTKKAADTDPYANGRIIVKRAEELDFTGSVAMTGTLFSTELPKKRAKRPKLLSL